MLLQILITLAITFALLGAGAGIAYLYRRRRKKVNRTIAEISRLSPRFKRQSPLKTQWLTCRYIFHEDRGGDEHGGECLLPLRYFIKTILPPGPVIVYDMRINMPVLITEEARVVGEEAIEHFLLMQLDSVEVSYLARDPSRHSVSEDGENLRNSAMKTSWPI